MNDDLRRIWKETVVGNNLLFIWMHHHSRFLKTLCKVTKLVSRQPVYRPKFEPETGQLGSRNAHQSKLIAMKDANYHDEKLYKRSRGLVPKVCSCTLVSLRTTSSRVEGTGVHDDLCDVYVKAKSGTIPIAHIAPYAAPRRHCWCILESHLADNSRTTWKILHQLKCSADWVASIPPSGFRIENELEIRQPTEVKSRNDLTLKVPHKKPTNSDLLVWKLR
jgi:hypothetical protein